MSSRRDRRGRFITDEATERVRHDIFGTASAESARLAGLIATDLFRSAKQQTFAHYQQLLRTDPPKWHGWALERQQMLTLMKAGRTPDQIATETGLPVSRIYTLGFRTRRAAAE